MVDASDEMSLLITRIRNVCECYKKLSGLNGLCVKNLKKKTENGYLDLEEDWLIGNYIQSKDIICFELSFSEIWLDIKMNLEKNNSFTTQFSLELKVVLNSDKKEFENTLIHLGITCMAKLVENDGDYYSFTQLIVDYPPVCSKYANDSKVYFEHDSKLTCILKFTNITEIVAKRILNSNNGGNNSNNVKLNGVSAISNNKRNKAVNDLSKVNEVKKYFNLFFKDYITKLDNITEYNHIIWKNINDDYDYEDNNSSFFCNESRTSRLSNNPINIFHNKNNAMIHNMNAMTNKNEVVLFSNDDDRHHHNNYNCNTCDACNRSVSIEMSLINDNNSHSERSSTNNYQHGYKAHNDNNSEYFPYKAYHHHQHHHVHSHKNSNKTINQDMKKYQSEYNYTQFDIDYAELLNKHCESYILLADFENRSPYTRNLTEVNSDSTINDDSDRMYYHNNNNARNNRNSVNTLNNRIQRREAYRIGVWYMYITHIVNWAMEYKYIKQITLVIVITVIIVIGFIFI